MKKIFLSCDIEGTAGICAWDETEWGDPRNEYFRAQMSREASSACLGALDAGADEIFVKDAHDSARNLDPKLLPKEAKLLRGWAGNMLSMMAGIDSMPFDAAMMTGYHACAGNDGNPLSHTMSSGRIDHVTINGIQASEFIINAYTAAYFGVPTCFVSGDASLCRSAKEFIPAITTVETNEGIGSAVVSIHPDLSCEKIREGVKVALSGDLSLCMPEKPEIYKIEIGYHKHQEAHAKSFYPGAVAKGSCALTFEHTDYLECLRLFHFVL